MRVSAEPGTIICNTGPLIAIAAATGDWTILRNLPERIIVPAIVCDELEAGPIGAPGRSLQCVSPWISVTQDCSPIPAYLSAALDRGEAAVISLALSQGISTVAIDERNARHIARSCGLHLTGSLGMLLRAQRHGAKIDMTAAIQRMRSVGVWISESLAREAIRLSAK
jgi:predicted nucleic acid-binding protein